MESRKMVLKNLFAGQHGRNGHREQTYEHGRGVERVRCMDRVTWKLTLPYVKQIANRNLLLALCQPRGVGWGGRWEGGSKERGHMYTYG